MATSSLVGEYPLAEWRTENDETFCLARARHGHGNGSSVWPRTGTSAHRTDVGRRDASLHEQPAAGSECVCHARRYGNFRKAGCREYDGESSGARRRAGDTGGAAGSDNRRPTAVRLGSDVATIDIHLEGAVTLAVPRAAAVATTLWKGYFYEPKRDARPASALAC